MSSTRCLYNNNFNDFYSESNESILRKLVNNYHGEFSDASVDAWTGEIEIMKNYISNYLGEEGQIIFEYDIPLQNSPTQHDSPIPLNLLYVPVDSP